MKIRNLTRRDFLLASGASMAAVPLLQSFRVRAETEAPPKRFVFLFNPNGVIVDQFWPRAAASDPTLPPAEKDFALNTITAPLEPFKDQLLFLEGVDTRTSEVGPGGPHQKGMGMLLTGRELQEGAFREDDGSLAGWANGRSVDQEIGSVIGQDTLLPTLELGARSGPGEVRTRIFYAGPAQPVPPEDDPLRAFTRISAGFTDSSGQSVAPVNRDLQRSILDASARQYAELGGAVGLEDRLTLERHATLIRDLERRLDVFVDRGDGCVLREPPQLSIDDENDMPDICKWHLDLIAASFACDLTRVASVQFSSAVNGIRFPWLGSLGHGHNLSHAGPSNLEATAELVLRGNWYAQQVAYLLGSLQAIPEGDGTMLDNTVIVWTSEISVGSTHDLTALPWLLAGSAGGTFSTGRYLKYDHASHTGLLLALLNAAGSDATEWGHPDFQSGPLPGLTA